ncbi:MAG: hypothetical protein KIT54_08635 [Phycisphaeraceae bacterium]|nr:hypothetical protein [Phycisphaeraceae bacterium]
MTRFLPLFVALCMIVVIPSAPGQEVFTLEVMPLAIFDDGTGEALYLGGSFRNPWRGTGPMRFIVVWRPGPGCPADINGDCQLDLLDWIHFGRLWRQQDPKADFDGDGEFTVFDYLAFQNAFDAGCP